MQVVAPGALDARNTLDKPDAVQAKPGEAKVNGQTVSFALPALSAAVLTIEKR
jgi:alpha-L-arabinofuranosidase